MIPEFYKKGVDLTVMETQDDMIVSFPERLHALLPVDLAGSVHNAMVLGLTGPPDDLDPGLDHVHGSDQHGGGGAGQGTRQEDGGRGVVAGVVSEAGLEVGVGREVEHGEGDVPETAGGETQSEVAAAQRAVHRAWGVRHGGAVLARAL